MYKGKIKDRVDEISRIAKNYFTDRYGRGVNAYFDENSNLISDNQFIFSYDMSHWQIAKKIDEINLDAFGFLYGALAIPSLGPCTFTQDDIKFLGGPKAVNVDAQQISCTNYVLLKKRESCARQTILERDDGAVNLDDLIT